LLDDQELAQRLGSAGRARAMMEYTLEAFVARTAEVYESAVWSLRASSHQGETKRVR
jgi:glycosyltransferase involved in cell wall biosynthesis